MKSIGILGRDGVKNMAMQDLHFILLCIDRAFAYLLFALQLLIRQPIGSTLQLLASASLQLLIRQPIGSTLQLLASAS
jgi:hypothetical protein